MGGAGRERRCDGRRLRILADPAVRDLPRVGATQPSAAEKPEGNTAVPHAFPAATQGTCCAINATAVASAWSSEPAPTTSIVSTSSSIVAAISRLSGPALSYGL